MKLKYNVFYIFTLSKMFNVVKKYFQGLFLVLFEDTPIHHA